MSQSPSYTRSSPRTAPNVFPTSQYLHERLQERRAKASRPRRTRQSDIGPQRPTARDDDIFVTEGDSTTRSATSQHGNSSVAGSTYRQTTDFAPVKDQPDRNRGVGGMKQLNDQLDRLTKLNFDLKLEVDHRRAHQVKLTTEIERMRTVVDRAEQLATEHTELLKINGQLVEELEKRDKAMQEAVEIICDLEERVAELDYDRQSVTLASTLHADSGYAGTESHEAASTSSPEKLKQQKPARIKAPTAASRKLNDAINASQAKAKREPSFMAQEDAGTRNLRSVYRDSAQQLRPIKSFHSILSKHTSAIDDDDYHGDVLNSPRFSNLSESSFPSIYSPRRSTAERNPWEPDETPAPTPATMAGMRGLHSRQDSITRVSQWIDGYDVTPLTAPQAATPIGSASTAATLDAKDQGRSINNTLAGAAAHVQDVPFRPHTAHDISRRSSRTPTSFGGPIFGEPMMSRCTDDSMHSKLLRASRSTIIDEKSLSDAPTARFRALQGLDAELRTAPKQMRSSLELKDAFASNMEYRKTGLSQMHQIAGSASSLDDDDADAYLGYPDGGSILLGTPSRFFKHDVPRNSESGANKSKTKPATRRKSSSAATADFRRPDLVRSGTSPSVLPPLNTLSTNGRPKTPSHGDAMSPISFLSNASSSRTAFAAPDHRSYVPASQQPRSPPMRSTERVLPSPARTLSQKTQSLLRRLSGSHGSDRDPRRQISPSPSRPVLPSLTSTPSSAYVNIIPKDMRRANAHAPDSMSRAAQAQNHTPTPVRTRAPSEIRQATPSAEIAERRGFFGRRGSFKQAIAGLERSKTTTPTDRGRRRSSVREVITSGKRW